jgi:hypothetical protein
MFDQKAIGCQLVNVCVIGLLGCASSFDLYRDYLLSLLDQIIWPARQAQIGIVEGLRNP